MYYFHTEKMPNMLSPVSIYTAFDRTRTIFDCKEIVPVIDIGKPDCKKDFDLICDERAIHIWQKAKEQNKRIAVFWSGGIDSTLSLVAILKTGNDSEVTVVINQESIREYPEYFEFLRRTNVGFFWVTRERTVEAAPKLQDDHLIVTGELGDQIFGSVKYKDYPSFDVLSKPWKEVLKIENKKTIETLEKFTAACPTKVETTKEFWWWLSYAVKYQGVCFRMLRYSDVILEKEAFHFFNNNDFNDWSVSTPMEMKFFGEDERNYKMIAKEYIYKETKDLDYKNNKLKQVSLYSDRSPYIEPKYTWVATDWSRG